MTSARLLGRVRLFESLDDAALERVAAASRVRTEPAGAAFFRGGCRAGVRESWELEASMHVHVHLENNVLFPRALALVRTFNPALA